MKNIFKNPKTYLLLIILTPVIIFAIFFFNYYSIYKNLIDPSENNSQQFNINTAVKNPFEDIDIIEEYNEKTLSTIEETIGNGEIIKEGDSSINNDKTIIENNDETYSPPNKTINTSYDYIVGTYKSKFEKLQSKQENNIYSLIEQGKAEYIKGGSKKTSALSLGSKYLSRINNMEKQSDKEFNMLIDNLKAELTRNSHNTDIVKEISDYYNYYKKTLRAQMLKKANKLL